MCDLVSLPVLPVFFFVMLVFFFVMPLFFSVMPVFFSVMFVIGCALRIPKHKYYKEKHSRH